MKITKSMWRLPSLFVVSIFVIAGQGGNSFAQQFDAPFYELKKRGSVTYISVTAASTIMTIWSNLDAFLDIRTTMARIGPVIPRAVIPRRGKHERNQNHRVLDAREPFGRQLVGLVVRRGESAENLHPA